MPLIYNHTSATGVVVGVWQINESSAELLSLLPLDDEQLALVNGFSREARKCEWLASRLVLMGIMGQYALLGYRNNGAPFLTNIDGFISMSHTKGYAAAIYHPSQPVGIDIEYTSDRVLKVTDRFLSKQELSFIPQNEAALYQTVCWCAKEAIYKWWGQPNVIFNADLRVNSFKVQNEPFTIEAEVGQGDMLNVLITTVVSQDYIMAYI